MLHSADTQKICRYDSGWCYMRQKFASSKVNKENQTSNVNKKADDCQKYAIWPSQCAAVH